MVIVSSKFRIIHHLRPSEVAYMRPIMQFRFKYLFNNQLFM